MRATLDDEFRRRAEEALRERGIDGWLLYGLEERNPVIQDVLGVAADPPSRRYFLFLRPDRDPAVLCHRIEMQPFEEWPGTVRSYVGWREMEDALAGMLEGCGRVAMEVSERDAVPFVDHVPAGVRDLVASLGPEVTGSAELIARTSARWGEEGRRHHDRSSRVLAEVAEAAFHRCADSLSGAAASSSPVTEAGLSDWIRGRLRERGLEEVDTIVAFGPNAANPHYAPPAEGSREAGAGEVFLVDLWGREAGEPRAVFADQTWMGVLGPEPGRAFREAWEAVRDARDETVRFVSERWEEGRPPTGAEADRAARRVLVERGYEDAIFHRTGHGMDRALHGFGPNLDSVETRDERPLTEGVGFSVEPGVYLEGEFGVRSEINVHMTADGPEVTTPHVQEEPWTAGFREEAGP